MEVHHHPDLHHKKKKFTEYFFEFLMIFLAVTMGFFAETLREDFTDHNKANQFAKSLLIDFKEDTATIHEMMQSIQKRIKEYDTLLSLLKTPGNMLWVNKLYYHYVATGEFNGFTSQDRTIEQLKSTGGLRLFEDTHLADSVTAYYQDVKGILDYSSTFLNYFREFHREAMEVFDFTQMGDLFFQREKLLDSNYHMPLLKNDSILRKKTYRSLFVLKVVSFTYIEDLTNLSREADGCINLIKKEYNPERN